MNILRDYYLFQYQAFFLFVLLFFLTTDFFLDDEVKMYGIASSTFSIATMLIPSLTFSEISFRSISFSFGISTVLISFLLAASSFSFNPPIASIDPVNVISPVIATSLEAGLLLIAESIAMAIVIPAEGPSFGMAPS